MVIKIKLSDTYTLTNKRITCHFKYVMLCLDKETHQYIRLTANSIRQLIQDNDIVLDSNLPDNFMNKVLKDCQSWHPSITQVNINTESILSILSIKSYGNNFATYQPFLSGIDGNLEQILDNNHLVCNIDVSFKLNNPISKISEYPANIGYSKIILNRNIIELNATDTMYLDEACVNGECVYPKIYLLPLYI